MVKWDTKPNNPPLNTDAINQGNISEYRNTHTLVEASSNAYENTVNDAIDDIDRCGIDNTQIKSEGEDSKTIDDGRAIILLDRDLTTNIQNNIEMKETVLESGSINDYHGSYEKK